MLYLVQVPDYVCLFPELISTRLIYFGMSLAAFFFLVFTCSALGGSNVWLEALNLRVSDLGSSILCTKFGYYTMYSFFITSTYQ